MDELITMSQLGSYGTAVGVVTILTNVICNVFNLRSKANLIGLLFSLIVVFSYTISQLEISYSTLFAAFLNSILIYSSAIGSSDLAASVVSGPSKNPVSKNSVQQSLNSQNSPEETHTIEKDLTDWKGYFFKWF